MPSIDRTFFHVFFRFGTRRNGACAVASHDYITREQPRPTQDPAMYNESDHLPTWAAGDAHRFWDAVDLYERADARLFVSADYALPRDFEVAEWIGLAHGFADDLTAADRLPFTMAIHAGLDRDGVVHNPHAHVMISERRDDGIARTPAAWFRRTDRDAPARGGTSRSQAFHRRGWLEDARRQWADRLNLALERKGRAERVDHRSYFRQGIDRLPGMHLGPAAAYLAVQGRPHDRLEEAAINADDRDRLAAIDQEIAKLETERDGLAHQVERFEESPPRDDDVSRAR